MYCLSIWFDRTVTSMKKLKIVYNNGLRRLLNLFIYNSASANICKLKHSYLYFVQYGPGGVIFLTHTHNNNNFCVLRSLLFILD